MNGPAADPAPSALRLWPSHVGAQIIALVVLAALFTYVGNILIVRSFERPPDTARADMQSTNVLFAALPVLSDMAPDRRQSVVDLVNIMAPVLDLRLETKPDLPASAMRRDARGPFTELGVRGGQLYSLGMTETGDRRLDRIAVVFADGSGLYAQMPLPPQPPPSFWSPQQFMMGNWLILLVVVLPLALLWAVRSVSRPLRRFARAAEDFSIDGPHAPLPERGPEEIRVAARALNRMRDRVAAMATDRTRMLSAVGHDLRTPVTRMRLRAEFITDPDIRSGQLRDLERMDAMIDDALVFLRDGQVQGTRAAADLASLIQTLVDDFVDMGANVGFSGPDRMVCRVEADALGRAIENLVQNAIKFGTKVEVGLTALPPTTTGGPGQAEIRVEDDGPGIAADDRATMLKPFVTGDSARGGEAGGFGLGLSIAEAIVIAHGGQMVLDDSSLGGLLVRVVLPCPTVPVSA